MIHPTVHYATPSFLSWLRMQDHETVNLQGLKKNQFNIIGVAGTFKISQKGNEIWIYLYSPDQKPPDAIWTTWINAFDSWQKKHWPEALQSEFLIIVTNSFYD